MKPKKMHKKENHLLNLRFLPPPDRVRPPVRWACPSTGIDPSWTLWVRCCAANVVARPGFEAEFCLVFLQKNKLEKQLSFLGWCLFFQKIIRLVRCYCFVGGMQNDIWLIYLHLYLIMYVETYVYICLYLNVTTKPPKKYSEENNVFEIYKIMILLDVASRSTLGGRVASQATSKIYTIYFSDGNPNSQVTGVCYCNNINFSRGLVTG